MNFPLQDSFLYIIQAHGFFLTQMIRCLLLRAPNEEARIQNVCIATQSTNFYHSQNLENVLKRFHPSSNHKLAIKNLGFVALWGDCRNTYSHRFGVVVIDLCYRVSRSKHLCFNLLWRIEICKSDLVWRWFDNPEWWTFELWPFDLVKSNHPSLHSSVLRVDKIPLKFQESLQKLFFLKTSK